MKDYIINKRIKELCSKQDHLTSEQNELLMQEYHQDLLNGVPLEESEARAILIMGNKKLIYYILKTRCNIVSVDDTLEEVSVGLVGLIKAVDTYKLNTGSKFLSYAIPVITNEIRMHYRILNSERNFAERTKIFLEDPINDGSGQCDNIYIKDMIVGDDGNYIDNIIDKEDYNKIIDNIKYLTHKEAFAVIHLLGLFGNKQLRQRQVGKMLGYEQCHTSRLFNSGLKKLKALTKKEEELSKEELLLRTRLLKQGGKNSLVEEYCGLKEFDLESKVR